MTPHNQIRALLREIDGILSKESPRWPWANKAGDLAQQRQTLEHLRHHLGSLLEEVESQTALAPFGPGANGPGTNRPGANRPESNRPEANSPMANLAMASLDISPEALTQASTPEAALGLTQQMMQGIALDLNQLRTSMINPLQSEIHQLHQQRDTLLQEIRQLERQRQQYELTAKQSGPWSGDGGNRANQPRVGQPSGTGQPLGLANQEQMVHDFLQGLMDRLQERLSQQVVQTLAGVETQALKASLSTETAASRGISEIGQEIPLPPLHPAQRFEQLRILQLRTDQIMVNLDTTLRIFAEALHQNIQGYQTSLAQSLDKMHSLGQQGEVVFAALINRLVEQMGDEAVSYFQALSQPEGSDRSNPGPNFSDLVTARRGTTLPHDDSELSQDLIGLLNQTEPPAYKAPPYPAPFKVPSEPHDGLSSRSTPPQGLDREGLDLGKASPSPSLTTANPASSLPTQPKLTATAESIDSISQAHLSQPDRLDLDDLDLEGLDWVQSEGAQREGAQRETDSDLTLLDQLESVQTNSPLSPTSGFAPSTAIAISNAPSSDSSIPAILPNAAGPPINQELEAFYSKLFGEEAAESETLGESAHAKVTRSSPASSPTLPSAPADSPDLFATFEAALFTEDSPTPKDSIPLDSTALAEPQPSSLLSPRESVPLTSSVQEASNQTIADVLIEDVLADVSYSLDEPRESEAIESEDIESQNIQSEHAEISKLATLLEPVSPGPEPVPSQTSAPDTPPSKSAVSPSPSRPIQEFTPDPQVTPPVVSPQQLASAPLASAPLANPQFPEVPETISALTELLPITAIPNGQSSNSQSGPTSVVKIQSQSGYEETDRTDPSIDFPDPNPDSDSLPEEVYPFASPEETLLVVNEVEDQLSPELDLGPDMLQQLNEDLSSLERGALGQDVPIEPPDLGSPSDLGNNSPLSGFGGELPMSPGSNSGLELDLGSELQISPDSNSELDLDLGSELQASAPDSDLGLDLDLGSELQTAVSDSDLGLDLAEMDLVSTPENLKLDIPDSDLGFDLGPMDLETTPDNLKLTHSLEDDDAELDQLFNDEDTRLVWDTPPPGVLNKSGVASGEIIISASAPSTGTQPNTLENFLEDLSGAVGDSSQANPFPEETAEGLGHWFNHVDAGDATPSGPDLPSPDQVDRHQVPEDTSAPSPDFLSDDPDIDALFPSTHAAESEASKKKHPP